MCAVLVAALSSCGGSVSADSAGSSNSKGNLTIVQADETSGKFVATFRQNGREITFDMRLGGPMEIPPDENEIDVPRAEIDAQVLDQNGQPIYMQMAGDEFIDPSWRVPALENIDEAGRQSDFALLQAAEPAFREADLPAAFDQLRLAAIQMARMVPELTAKPDSPNALPAIGANLSAPANPADERVAGPSGRRAQANIVYGSTSVNYWDYRIWRKDAFISGSPFDHSAVQLRGWTSGYTHVFSAISCNHGTCAATSNMSVKCTMTGFLADDGTHSRYFYNEPSTDTSVTSGCSTPYGALFDNGKHVCNDDTILQIYAIKYDHSYSRSTGATGECSDDYANYWAPTCI
jgi:hypothetical protein